MWNALKVRNNLTKTIVKKLAVVLFVMAITLVTVGCAPKQVEVIDSPTTANTPVSPEPKPAPSPPIDTKSPRELELEELLEKAPEIEGLTKFIEDDKIIYKNNEGVKSGYYVVKAYYNGEETDGVSLSIDVIKQLSDQKQEEGPNTSFSLPVDPKEGQVVSVEFQQEIIRSGNTHKNGYFYIYSETPIDIINSFANNQNILRAFSSPDGGKTRYESCFVMTNDMNLISGTLAFHLKKTEFINPVFPTSKLYSPFLGELLGRMQGTLVLERASGNREDLNKYFAHESNLLKINDSLVFTMQKVVN